jgi:hypothetical protein
MTTTSDNDITKITKHQIDRGKGYNATKRDVFLYGGYEMGNNAIKRRKNRKPQTGENMKN